MALINTAKKVNGLDIGAYPDYTRAINGANDFVVNQPVQANYLASGGGGNTVSNFLKGVAGGSAAVLPNSSIKAIGNNAANKTVNPAASAAQTATTPPTAPTGLNTVKMFNPILNGNATRASAANGASGTGNIENESTTTTVGGGNLPTPQVTPPVNTNDYMNQLSNMLQAYQRQQQEQLRAQQEAQAQLVRQAYDNNRSAMQDAYNRRLGALEDTYNGTVDQLGNNYNYSADRIERNAENALREAYINRMMSQRNLAQQLDAAGLSGGAAESAIAGLINNYGSTRAGIENQRATSLTDLLNAYQNNMAKARENYNNARNEADATNMEYARKLENDLANGVIGTYDGLYSALNSGANTYANAMQGLAANLVGNDADLAATNYKNYLNAQNTAYNNQLKALAKGTTSTSSSKSSTDSTITTNLAQRLQEGVKQDVLLKELVQSGMSQEEAVKALRKAGANI